LAKDHLGEVEVSNGAAIGGALMIFLGTWRLEWTRLETRKIFAARFLPRGRASKNRHYLAPHQSNRRGQAPALL
jgi:hypothetical protein